ncbi:MAG: hypothetical protein ACLP52_05770 [Streptosporangiaceae bacterium]
MIIAAKALRNPSYDLRADVTATVAAARTRPVRMVDWTRIYR